MTNWPHRLRLAAYTPLVLIAVGIVLRPVLYAVFHSGSFSVPDLSLALGVGLVYDALVGILVATPLTLALATLRLRILERRWARFALFAAIGTGAVFSAFIEWFFFEEFNSRFNNIAIDYIRSPNEVLGNIRESYQLGTFAAAALLAGGVLAIAGLRATRGTTLSPLPLRARLKWGAAALLVTVLAASALEVLPSDASHDRIISEIAQNGIDRLVHAARTGSLEYAVYYRTLPIDLARRRAASVLDAPWIRGREAAGAATVPTGSAPEPRPWDVVVILEESLGSEATRFLVRHGAHRSRNDGN